jgi:hypothetical protein
MQASPTSGQGRRWSDAPRLAGPQPFTEELPALPLRREVANDLRRQRNYPDPPPIFPMSRCASSGGEAGTIGRGREVFGNISATSALGRTRHHRAQA